MKERRKYSRYNTELEVYFRVKYDITTKVKFRILKNSREGRVTHKYSGLCKNVSAQGLEFVSGKKLRKGDILLLDVYEPVVKHPVKMEGKVCWSRRLPAKTKEKYIFYTGVILLSVMGKPVADSIHFDKEYNVMWSAALESLFGSFAAMVKRIKKGLS